MSGAAEHERVGGGGGGAFHRLHFAPPQLLLLQSAAAGRRQFPDRGENEGTKRLSWTRWSKRLDPAPPWGGKDAKNGGSTADDVTDQSLTALRRWSYHDMEINP